MKRKRGECVGSTHVLAHPPCSLSSLVRSFAYRGRDPQVATAAHLSDRIPPAMGYLSFKKRMQHTRVTSSRASVVLGITEGSPAEQERAHRRLREDYHDRALCSMFGHRGEVDAKAWLRDTLRWEIHDAPTEVLPEDPRFSGRSDGVLDASACTSAFRGKMLLEVKSCTEDRDACVFPDSHYAQVQQNIACAQASCCAYLRWSGTRCCLWLVPRDRDYWDGWCYPKLCEALDAAAQDPTGSRWSESKNKLERPPAHSLKRTKVLHAQLAGKMRIIWYRPEVLARPGGPRSHPDGGVRDTTHPEDPGSTQGKISHEGLTGMPVPRYLSRVYGVE